MLPVNSGYDVFANHFDSVNLHVIGISGIHIHQNHFANTTLGNYIALFFSAPYGGTIASGSPARNIQIDHNTLDARTANHATISGQAQDDAPGQGAIEGLSIVGNVIRGISSSVHVNTSVPVCLTDCLGMAQTYDVEIANNVLVSYGSDAHSQIDLRGGTYGLVQTAIVHGNMLLSASSEPGDITPDSHTTQTNIANNM